MKNWIRNNNLSLTFLVLFVLALAGQFVTGYNESNEQRKEEGQHSIPMSEDLYSGHFIQATFENWESEFLQMALFVVLTIFLKQKGSSESKKFDGAEEVDRTPSPERAGAPWAVKKGGVVLKIYQHSLSLALGLLFIFSFVFHFYGSLKEENEHLSLKQLPLQSASEYFFGSRFWFESLQNWQSEFLSVFAIVILSVYLRQKGSPQSKPVDAPDSFTGE